MIKVSTKALQNSFEYFESIKVTEKIKIFVTDIRNNSRHSLYQYIIRYECFNRIVYKRDLGAYEEIIKDLNEINERVQIWDDGDFF